MRICTNCSVAAQFKQRLQNSILSHVRDNGQMTYITCVLVLAMLNTYRLPVR